MDAPRVGRYRENLLARKKRVATVIDNLMRRAGDGAAQRHFDWIDQAWDETDARTADRLADLYAHELAGIDRALERVAAGTFGSCVACSRPIEPSRLDVFPQTEFCRACGDFREAFERAA